MNGLLTGAIAMGYMIAALFFLKFWTQTRDRFFLFFVCSFVIEGLNRSIAAIFDALGDADSIIFSIRLISYLIILIAILDKNISSSGGRAQKD